MIAGQKAGQWPRALGEQGRRGSRSHKEKSLQQHAPWGPKLARGGQKSMGLAMRFVGSHTSFFWKDDIKAEAMTRVGIPRLHRMESGSDSI